METISGIIVLALVLIFVWRVMNDNDQNGDSERKNRHISCLGKTDLQRYHGLANWVINCCITAISPERPKAYIEDYAYARHWQSI